MKFIRRVRFAALLIVWSFAAIAIASASQAQTSEDAPCSNTPNLDHPHVVLTSGDLHLVVFLPDAKTAITARNDSTGQA